MFTRIEKVLISILIAAAALAVVTMFLEDPRAEVNAAEQYFIKWEPIDTEPPEFNVEKFSNPEPVTRVGGEANPPLSITTTQTVKKPTAADAPATGDRLTRSKGVHQGPSGKETFYNLPMQGVVRIMRQAGFSEEEYPYWVRDDGAKMLGPYVLCAANLELRPRGTIIETSLGQAIVADTGAFCQKDTTAVDLATNW